MHILGRELPSDMKACNSSRQRWPCKSVHSGRLDAQVLFYPWGCALVKRRAYTTHRNETPIKLQDVSLQSLASVSHLPKYRHRNQRPPDMHDAKVYATTNMETRKVAVGNLQDASVIAAWPRLAPAVGSREDRHVDIM